MEFDGTFTLDGATIEEVWLALSDPNLVWHALPGCVFLVPVEDEEPDFEALRDEYGDLEPDLTADPDEIAERAFEAGGRYAAVLELSVGSVNPSFRTTVTIDERDEPRMGASGEGSAGNSSFEMNSSMTLSEHEEGVDVEWHAEADVFGRIAQMGQRMINPVANRVVKRFFTNVQETLAELSADEASGEAGAAADEESTGDEGSTGVDGTSGDDGTADEGAGANGEHQAGTTGGDGSATGATDETEAEGEDSSSSGQANQKGGLLDRLKRLLGIGG